MGLGLCAGCGEATQAVAALSGDLTRAEAQRLLAATMSEEACYLKTVATNFCKPDGRIVLALADQQVRGGLGGGRVANGRVPQAGDVESDRAYLEFSRSLTAAGFSTPFRFESRLWEPNQYTTYSKRELVAETRGGLEAEPGTGQPRCRLRVGTLASPEVTGVTRQSPSEAAATYQRSWIINQELVARIRPMQSYFGSEGERTFSRLNCAGGRAITAEARFRRFDDGWRLQ